MVLQPLRFVAQHEIVLEPDDTVHRADCSLKPVGRHLPEGTVLERQKAPRACRTCFPELHLRTGR